MIKFNGLRWTGHIIRIRENEHAVRKINTEPDAKMGFDRPSLTWIDGVRKEWRRLPCKN